MFTGSLQSEQGVPVPHSWPLELNQTFPSCPRPAGQFTEEEPLTAAWSPASSSGSFLDLAALLCPIYCL